MVFSKVAARLGGKVKAIVNGGAPLSLHVEEFLRAAMCCPVVQVGPHVSPDRVNNHASMSRFLL